MNSPPRSKNLDADALANLGSSISSEYRRTILVKILAYLSILDVEVVFNAEKTDETWLDPILSFIQNKTFPANKFET